MSEVAPEAVFDDRIYESDPLTGDELTVGRVISIVSEGIREKGLSSEARFRTSTNEGLTTVVLYEIPPVTEEARIEDTPGFWEDTP